jgi:hypothetical protein
VKYDAFGAKIYHWAGDANTDGQVVGAGAFNTADRLTKGYHEVSFGYQLARACAVWPVGTGCSLSLAAAGQVRPARHPQLDRYLPTYSAVDGSVTRAGRACWRFLPGGNDFGQAERARFNRSPYRQAGLYRSQLGRDDGTVEYKNQNPVDAGAYITLSASTPTVQQLRLVSQLDRWPGLRDGLGSRRQEPPTNKPLVSARQLYKAGLAQLDALTKANVNMLRFRRQPPVLLTMTAANDKAITRTCCGCGSVPDPARSRDEADKLGESTTDGCAAGLRTALDARFVDLQARLHRRYRTRSRRPRSTSAWAARSSMTFMPADELGSCGPRWPPAEITRAPFGPSLTVLSCLTNFLGV